MFTASSRTVNTLTFQASSNRSETGHGADSANYSTELGLRGIGGQLFPVIRFSPYLGMGHSYPISNNAQKIVFLPYETSGIMASLGGIRELLTTPK